MTFFFLFMERQKKTLNVAASDINELFTAFISEVSVLRLQGLMFLVITVKRIFHTSTCVHSFRGIFVSWNQNIGQSFR